MPRPTILITAALAIAIAALTFVAACQTRHRTIQVGPGGPEFAARAEREENIELDLVAGAVLGIEGSTGPLRIEVTHSGRSEFRARLVAAGRDAQEAEAVLARYSLNVVRDAQGVHVRVIGQPLRVEGGSVQELAVATQITVFVPPGTAIDACGSTGSIEASGPLGDTQLETSFGAVAVSGVRGALDVQTGSGRIDAVDIEGPRMRLDSAFGAVTLARIRTEGIAIRTGSGGITVEDVESVDLDAHTQFGSIAIGGLRGNAQLATGSGSIDVDGVDGTLHARSEFGAIGARGRFDAVTLESGSGAIELHARPQSRMASDWSLVSGFGAVRVRLPADFGGELDAHTSFGAVDCELALLIEAVAGSTGRGVRGRIAAPAAPAAPGTLTLRTGSGNVRIERARE